MKTKELIVPNTFDEITLKQWQEFVAEGEDVSDESLISIMCNITPQEVFELPNSVYGQAVNFISVLLKSVSDEHKLQRTFKMGGIEYGMIPNLNEISYGENKDIIAFLGDWKNMHLAMTVLFRPITIGAKDTYAIEKYDGKLSHQDKMLEMPLSVVFGAQVFFLEFNKRIVAMYPELFRKTVKDGEEGQETISAYQEEWGSYDESYCLAQGDVRRFDEISEMNMHKCYMYLAHNVARIKQENKRNK